MRGRSESVMSWPPEMRWSSCSASLSGALLLVGLCFSCAGIDDPEGPQDRLPRRFRGEVISIEDLAGGALRRARDDASDLIVLTVDEEPDVDDLKDAAQLVRRAGFALGFWIEVGPSVTLARRRPELLAKLRGHAEWRRDFPGLVMPPDGEEIVAWPWIPILSDAGLAAQTERVLSLIDGLPPAELVFLDGLQGAPSACGCGNPLCRWAIDYEPSGPDGARGGAPEPRAAAELVNAVRARLPEGEVVPVFAPECERDDPRCHGIPCAETRCPGELAAQWRPLVATADRLAVLALHTSFARRRADGSADLGFPERALDSFTRQVTPAGDEVETDRGRLVGVLDGEPYDPELERTMEATLRAAGTRGIVFLRTGIRLGYEPRGATR